MPGIMREGSAPASAPTYGAPRRNRSGRPDAWDRRRWSGVCRRRSERGGRRPPPCSGPRSPRSPGAGEDDVEVLDVEQVRLARLNPRRAGERLALVAVPIAAGVMPDAPMAAVVTLLDVSAQGRGPTLLDGGHDPALGRGEGRPSLDPKGRPVAAEHLRHGGRHARHRQPSVGRWRDGRHGPREEVEWTGGGAHRDRRDPKIARRGLEPAMPEQELNRAQIGARVEEMDREGVSEGVNTLLITRS